MERQKAFTLVELLGVMVILGAILLVTVPSITKTLKNRKEEEYQRFLSDIYLAAESYVGTRKDNYTEIDSSGRGVVELKELIEAGYISENKVNPKTQEVINPLETVMVMKQTDGTYSYALSGKENGKSSYVKNGLLLWLDGKDHGDEEFVWRDLSGNGNHGTLKGFDNNQQRLWDANALYFDGVDDGVAIGQVNPSYVTIEATVKAVGGLTASYYLIGNWNAGGYGLAFLNSEQKTLFEVYTTAYQSIRIPNSFSLNQMYHLVGTFDGTKVVMWINGVKQTTEVAATGTIGIPTSNTILMLGGNPHMENIQSNFSNVYFYSTRVYDRALTEAEIQKNYEIERMRFGI